MQRLDFAKLEASLRTLFRLKNSFAGIRDKLSNVSHILML